MSGLWPAAESGRTARDDQLSGAKPRRDRERIGSLSGGAGSAGCWRTSTGDEGASPIVLDTTEALYLLTHGTTRVVGRLVEASNATLFWSFTV